MIRSKIIIPVVVLLFITAVCFSVLLPISSPDFYWHLATGRWIAEHGSLPTSDPFTFTSALSGLEELQRSKIILTQYWLTNLLQFGCYSLLGFNGIIVLRLVIVLMTFLVLALHLRNKNLKLITIMILFMPVLFVVSLFTSDRPNQITILCVVLFMYLVDALKRNEKKGFMLPVLMLLWANLHGGFLFGAVVSTVMIISELIRKSVLDNYSMNKRLIMIMALNIVAGALNPNGYSIALSIFFELPEVYKNAIIEMQPMFFYTKRGDSMPLFVFAAGLFFTGLYFVWRIFPRPLKIKERVLMYCDEFMIAGFLIALSLNAVRFVPLFFLVSISLAAPLFSQKIEQIIDRWSVYVVPQMLMSAVFIWVIFSYYPNTVFQQSVVSPFFPDDAVQFIRQKGLKGNFFNNHDWGGYLEWQFYPEKWAFIDSRSVNLTVFQNYYDIITGRQKAQNGIARYKNLLDSYSVTHLLIPAVNKSGDLIRLLRPLVNDPEWKLIFIGRNSLIYTRDKTEQEYDKTMSYNLALSNALDMVGTAPNNPLPYLTIAKANILLGRPQSAVDGLKRALQERPGLRGGPVEQALVSLREGKGSSVGYE